MIFALLAAASLTAKAPASAAPVPPPVDSSILQDAAHAIGAGRLVEAKLLIARAITAGYRGTPIDRLTADLDFASKRYNEAWSAYRRLAWSPSRVESDCEKGAISALQVGRLADAKPLVQCAIASPEASWQAWNALGVLADSSQAWAVADQAYSRAQQLAPAEPRIVNNQGWSKLLRGDWAGAAALFEQAAAEDPKSDRIANNLELARAAIGADLPQRRAGESERDWAVRLNDAGVAAELLGDRKRAIAAFTQALDASPSWYDRASNNLKALSQN
jgi:Flp pilus assembly protein TadD